MDAPKKQFWDLIKLLNESNVLPHVVLVGSWAEYIYEKSNVLDGYISRMKTMDVDFLMANIRKPTVQTDLILALRENGYRIDQSLQGYSIIQKDYLEVEFLVCEKGAGKSEPYVLSNLGGIKATGLRFMDLLVENSMQINTEGLNVKIPTPAVYAIHKILINSRRSEKKQGKDIIAVMNVLQYIRKSPEETARMQNIFNSMPKSWQKEVLKSIKNNNLSVPLKTLETEHER